MLDFPRVLPTAENEDVDTQTNWDPRRSLNNRRAITVHVGCIVFAAEEWNVSLSVKALEQ